MSCARRVDIECTRPVWWQRRKRFQPRSDCLRDVARLVGAERKVSCVLSANSSAAGGGGGGGGPCAASCWRPSGRSSSPVWPTLPDEGAPAEVVGARPSWIVGVFGVAGDLGDLRAPTAAATAAAGRLRARGPAGEGERNQEGRGAIHPPKCFRDEAPLSNFDRRARVLRCLYVVAVRRGVRRRASWCSWCGARSMRRDADPGAEAGRRAARRRRGRARRRGRSSTPSPRRCAPAALEVAPSRARRLGLLGGGHRRWPDGAAEARRPRRRTASAASGC